MSSSVDGLGIDCRSGDLEVEDEHARAAHLYQRAALRRLARKRWTLVLEVVGHHAESSRAGSRLLRLDGPSQMRVLPRTGLLEKGLGYSYPKSMVANGFLFVAYSTNKEDVQCTRVPLESLELDLRHGGPASAAFFVGSKQGGSYCVAAKYR
ncbi:MAG: hypothetical protein ABW061_23880 [Polyangiaceae bacterium]